MRPAVTGQKSLSAYVLDSLVFSPNVWILIITRFLKSQKTMGNGREEEGQG